MAFATQPAFEPPPPLRVLVVDDSFEDRILYKRLLRKTNGRFEVMEAVNAAEGLALGEKFPVDCVVLDYNLPDSDGIDFISAFQQKSHTPDAAIVMVTGQGNEQTAVEAMKSGALDYITKSSISDGYFIQCIHNAIERARLRQQVEKYQRDLEKSNRALSEFAHIVSHDLKAPLRRMASYCELLKEEAGTALPGESNHFVERITNNAERMQRFIDDLLAFSRVMHAEEELKLVDVNAIVADVLEDLEPLIEENKARVTVAQMPSMEVYPVRIRQVFQNLISNAIKYRGDADPVISVFCQADDDAVKFSVQDNGMGIPLQYQENIFKAFQRLHTQDEIEGTGLGLSIVREVVEMHRGNASVASEPGKGATFSFTIPSKIERRGHPLRRMQDKILPAIEREIGSTQ